jgi:hypothetical protein
MYLFLPSENMQNGGAEIGRTARLHLGWTFAVKGAHRLTCLQVSEV